MTAFQPKTPRRLPDAKTRRKWKTFVNRTPRMLGASWWDRMRRKLRGIDPIPTANELL